MTSLAVATGSPSPLWPTLLFSSARQRDAQADEPGAAVQPSSVSARAAYQELLYERAVLVDIRPTPQRRREGSVSDSLPVLSLEHLEGRLDADLPGGLPLTDAGPRVIVLCQDGSAGWLAAELLAHRGVRRAGHVDGGFAAWSAAGLPTADAI